MQKFKKLNTHVFYDPATLTTEVKLYNTTIVKFTEASITLNTGGFETVTTRRRMNQVSEFFNLDYYVYQRKNVWWVSHKHAASQKFSGSITLDRFKRARALPYKNYTSAVQVAHDYKKR